MAIEDTHPIHRSAMGRTILSTKQSLQQRLETSGNNWLDSKDDPYEVDDKRSGLCMIGMKSLPAGGDDRTRLTYQCVFDVLQALWDVLYFKRRSYEAAFEIHNGTNRVGTGKVVVGNVPIALQRPGGG